MMEIKVKDILRLSGNNINNVIFHKLNVGSANCCPNEVHYLPEWNLTIRKFYIHGKTIEFEI